MAAVESDAEPNPDILTEFKPFQESLEAKIVKEDGTYIEAHPRKIVHVMTHDGERGKSIYVKHLEAKHGALLIDYEGATNVKCLIAGKEEELNALGRSALIVIDIPRSACMDRKELYTMIESIKNGRFMSGKYQPKSVRLDFTPHVWVFSNENLAIQFLSGDKYECHTLDNDDNLVLNPLMVDEQIRVANEQHERQQLLLRSIRTRATDAMDSIFDGCFEVEEGNQEAWYVKRMHAILTEAAPNARLPALGGPVALGIWLAKKFPDDHPSVAKGHDVRGNFYTGLKRVTAAAPLPAAAE